MLPNPVEADTAAEEDGGLVGELVQKKATESIPDEGLLIEVGQWYWIKENDEKGEWFGCVAKVGSNFVEMHGVPEGSHGSNRWTRIHFDEFSKVCRRETNPETVIQGNIEVFRGIVREKLSEIRAITARLGITSHLKVEHNAPGEDSSRALSVLSGTDNIKEYKKALIKAKEKDLPALFKEMGEANENLVHWMSAQAIPMKALAEGMEGVVGEIKDRIFNVTLYAGLTEEVVQITKGEAATVAEKLHILQRLLYMDEECLLDYKHGGMEFKNLKAFDKWLAKKENQDRILPFPRALVAFRVRRDAKNRDWDGSLRQIKFLLDAEESDKLTFLYIRNGERLYRMNCDLQFGELIFPGRDELDLNEPMMAKMFCSKVNEIITKRHYDDLVREKEEGKRKRKEWEKANPKKNWMSNPFMDHSFTSLSDYEPFNPTSVFYDEIKDEIGNRVKQYNRIALIVQGLYDRSEVLHPHPPVRLWDSDGFSSAVELVYDGSKILHYGPEPDWETYRNACNASITEGSITVGQELFWTEKEAEKESRRMDNDWRFKGEYRPKHFTPYGNPGPGYLAKVERWIGKSRKAVFQWTRKRLQYPRYASMGDLISCTLAVPDARLLNVSAYKPGDFKQFFWDPRTRAKYLKWAPTLLAAEEYHAGNLKVGPEDSA